MNCPGCHKPRVAPSIDELLDEDAGHFTGAAPADLNKLSREWLVLGLRGLGYCQQCIMIKGSIIGAEVGAAAVSSPSSKSDQEIKTDYLGLNLLRFPARRQSVSLVMPNKGA